MKKYRKWICLLMALFILTVSILACADEQTAPQEQQKQPQEAAAPDPTIPPELLFVISGDVLGRI